jgi:hypothetical protein
MANLWTTYNFLIDDVPGFRVGVGLNYRDKTFSDITNEIVVRGMVCSPKKEKAMG